MTKPLKTINIEPTWLALVDPLVMILRQDTIDLKTRQETMAELRKMARGADLWNEHMRRGCNGKTS